VNEQGRRSFIDLQDESRPRHVGLSPRCCRYSCGANATLNVPRRPADIA
jgi:hypothetical protein